MSRYSVQTKKHHALSSLFGGLVRATRIACAITLSMMTLSCSPGTRAAMTSRAYREAPSIVDSLVWGLVDAVQVQPVDMGTVRPAVQSVSDGSMELVAASASAATDMIGGAYEASDEAVTPTEAAPGPAGATTAQITLNAEQPVEYAQDGDIRFDWTSVDTYHENPPLWNALGRFEERWYAAHNFTGIGAGIASLAEGDLLRVDGVTLRVSWIYDGSYESTYDEVRSIVGDESYCLQTCTGVGTGIIVVVCYPA